METLLYDKYLKRWNKQTNEEHKQFKSRFEATKKKSKTLFYSKLIEKYKNNARKTWDIVKD